MQGPGSKWLSFLPIAAGTLGLDQLLKRHVMENLEVGERVRLLGDALALTHVPSVGGAFGAFQSWLPGAQRIGFTVIALCAIGVILSYFRALGSWERGTAAGLGVMLGGIASHVLDRIRFGSGLDSIHIGPTHSNAVPDFSLADIAIVLGVATLVVELLATEMAGRAAERLR